MKEQFLVMLFILALHLIGGLITLIVYYFNGTFEFAAKHGDGVRLATPSDVVTTALMLWEVELIISFIFFIDDKLNNFFCKKYGEE